jgi:hypothetical protein
MLASIGLAAERAQGAPHATLLPFQSPRAKGIGSLFIFEDSSCCFPSGITAGSCQKAPQKTRFFLFFFFFFFVFDGPLKGRKELLNLASGVTAYMLVLSLFGAPERRKGRGKNKLVVVAE